MKYRLIATVRVKNEAWILETWLKRTSEYVDGIVALDNGSTDGSTKMLRGCPRVVRLIEKPSDRTWNELPDRNLLLDEARRLGCEWIHIIDPDEIMDARLAGYLDEILRDRETARHLFREITLWRSVARYRIDQPEKYHRHSGTNKIIRLTPGVRWKHPGSWKRRLYYTMRHLRIPHKKHVGDLSLVGADGPKRYHNLVRLHYHYVDWNRAWFLQMRYAVIEAIQSNRPLRDVDQILRWSLSRLDERGLITEEVKPEWGAISLEDSTSLNVDSMLPSVLNKILPQYHGMAQS